MNELEDTRDRVQRKTTNERATRVPLNLHKFHHREKRPSGRMKISEEEGSSAEETGSSPRQRRRVIQLEKARATPSRRYASKQASLPRGIYDAARAASSRKGPKRRALSISEEREKRRKEEKGEEKNWRSKSRLASRVERARKKKAREARAARGGAVPTASAGHNSVRGSRVCEISRRHRGGGGAAEARRAWARPSSRPERRTGEQKVDRTHCTQM